MPDYPPLGITKLSELTIDVVKDWLAYRIANIGVPTTTGDALRKGTRLTATEMLDGPSGQVLTGQGAGVNPAYASPPPPNLQRGSGAVTVGTSEVDIVSITPTRLPAYVIVIFQAVYVSASSATVKITNGANVVLTIGSAHGVESDPTGTDTFARVSWVRNSLSITQAYSDRHFIGTMICIVASGTTTPIKVRGVRSLGSGEISAEMDVIS